MGNQEFRLKNEEVLAQKDKVNALLGTIGSEFSDLVNMARELGQAEAIESSYLEHTVVTGQINYAISILQDMVDSCETPKETISKLQSLLEHYKN